MTEGWYLMSTRDLEIELKRWRSEGDGDPPPSNALRLSVEEALDYRNSGNLPDDEDRTLRLVLVIAEPSDAARLGELRLRYEPDYHEPPMWRREGSKPVNLVPLKTEEIEAEGKREHFASPNGIEAEVEPGAWWQEPDLAALEREWSRTGAVAGVRVPGPYRGFVYKTVLELRAAGREVSAEAIAGSIARWVPPREGERIRDALLSANPTS